MYTLQFEPDPNSFKSAALPFLCKEEAENYFAFAPVAEGKSLLQGVAFRDDKVTGVFWVNESLVLGLTGAPPEVVPLVAKTLQEKGVALAGVIGPAEVADSFAQLWGQEGLLVLSSSVLKLQSVIPPRKTKGRFRHAEVPDSSRVSAWVEDFAEETGLELTEEEAETQTAESISQRARYVWESNGEIVSMAFVSQRTPTGARIHWVYTPPRHRKKGFASALVGALSQKLLSSGSPFCFVVTGSESSQLYRAIGYVPVRSLAFWEFKAQTEGPAGSRL